MFYSTQILARKGPLGVVWLAAHMDSRLKRGNVSETSITTSVESILNPAAPLALRLSGQLLLGVVRIYNRQLVYLYEDCNDTLAKLQQAFRQAGGEAVLAARGTQAPAGHITIPEDCHMFGGAWDGADELNLAAVDMSQLKPFSIEPASRPRAGGAAVFSSPGASHGMFASPLSYDNERFDVGGEELERHMSMGPSEVLREAAPDAAVQRLFGDAEAGGGGGMSLYDPEEELLPAVPMDDFFEGPEPPPSLPPSSRAGGSRRHSLAEGPEATPPPESPLGGLGVELGLPALEVQPDSARGVARQARAGERRRAAVRDVAEDGRPATMLSTNAIRALMADRGPLLRTRGATQPGQPQPLDKRRKLWLATWHEQPGLGELPQPLMAMFRIAPTAQADAAGQEEAGAAQAQAPAARSPRIGLHVNGDAAAMDADAAPQDDAPPPLDAPEPPLDDFFAGGADGGFFDDAPMDGGRTPLSPVNGRADAQLGSPGSSRRPGSSRKRQGGDADAGEDETEAGYAARTQRVLRQVKSKLGGASGSKRQRVAADAAVGFDELHRGGGRTEAARLFFDLLTLQARKQVVLRQEDAYSPVCVSLPQ